MIPIYKFFFPVSVHDSNECIIMVVSLALPKWRGFVNRSAALISDLTYLDFYPVTLSYDLHIFMDTY
jgi:hypothetical protein